MSREQVQKSKTNENDRSQLSYHTHNTYSKSIGLDKSGITQTKQQPFKSNISNVDDQSQDKTDGQNSDAEYTNNSDDFDRLASIPV